jgi:hypothetical protein
MSAQDACSRLKAGLLKLQSVVKASEKLGILHAKPQVDALSQKFIVRPFL